MSLQVSFSRAFELLLLGLVDAHGGTAETSIAAQTHFNKNQRSAVLHNQVDFTVCAAKVFFNQLQPFSL